MADTNPTTVLGPSRHYRRRLAKLKIEHSSWVSHYRELSDYLSPRRGRFLATETNRGRKRNTKIIDSTGTQALRTMASGMMSGMTSPVRPWFRTTTPDPELMEFGAVKDWIAATDKVMYAILARSNFYNSIYNVYVELGSFGTGPMYREQTFDDVVRYRPLTAGEYYIAENAQGIVDTVYREYTMTVSQIVEEFVAEPDGTLNWDVASPAVKRAWDNSDYDQLIEVVHAVEPRRSEDRDFTKLDGKNKPIKSVYYETGASDGKLLRESGFDSMPIYTPRWDVLGGDVYGRGPGMDALGDVKQLQQEQKRKAQGIDKMVNPPMTAPTSLRGKPASVLPGGTTYVDVNQGQQGFIPAYQVKPDISGLMADIQEVQGRIQRAFYADLFAMMLSSDRRQMTATEVVERHEEKLVLLGPVLQRLNTELLDPVIDDVFAFALERGLLPPPPPELQGVELKVEYISLLAQAQQAVGASSIERTLGFAGNLISAFPGITDKIDADQALDEYSQILGTPNGVVRSDEEVEALRAERAEAEAQAAATEQLAVGADTAKVLSETDTQSPNALTDLLGRGQTV